MLTIKPPSSLGLVSVAVPAGGGGRVGCGASLGTVPCAAQALVFETLSMALYKYNACLVFFLEGLGS